MLHRVWGVGYPRRERRATQRAMKNELVCVCHGLIEIPGPARIQARLDSNLLRWFECLEGMP